MSDTVSSFSPSQALSYNLTLYAYVYLLSSITHAQFIHNIITAY